MGTLPGVRRLLLASTLVIALAVGALGTGVALMPAHPASAQGGPPAAEPARDLRSDKLSGPRHEDSTPGRAAGLPLAVAGVAAFGVVVVLVLRSRRRQGTTSA